MDDFELQPVDGLPVPKTKAEFWDSQLECLERKKGWLHHGLLDTIEMSAGRRNLNKTEVMKKLVELIVQKSELETRNVNDRVVRFDDGSRLVLFDIGGNTCAGLSRVLDGDGYGCEAKCEVVSLTNMVLPGPLGIGLHEVLFHATATFLSAGVVTSVPKKECG